ncbi:MAG TPA: hypothetical protein VGU21_02935, partial [Streptosporangiaceae bacterium]|nr:hypothetical protein [Streptosporangiaceae bacterium]
GSGVLLGGPAPRPLVWAGMAVVAAGLTLGFRKSPSTGVLGRGQQCSQRRGHGRADRLVRPRPGLLDQQPGP